MIDPVRQRLRDAAATFRAWSADKLRASPLAVLFIVTFCVTIFLNPVKLGPAIWGVAKVTLGAYIGYWADRLCFRPEDRPHKLSGIAQGTAWKRRAVVVAAGIVGMGMIQ